MNHRELPMSDLFSDNPDVALLGDKLFSDAVVNDELRTDLFMQNNRHL